MGSALADVIGGFFIFTPITLVAKGLEGFLAGVIGETKIKVVLLPLASFTMVAIYFISEIFLPGMGIATAVSELPMNIIQAVVGAFGGYFVYIAVMKALPQKKAL